MRTPSNSRFTSAFLFALTLLIVIYTSFWFYTMQKTEEGLVASLRDILGGDISYDQAEWNYDLSRINITVTNTVSRFKNKTTGDTYIHHLGDLSVSSDIFQNFHVVIEFPQQQRIKVEKERKIVDSYLLNLDGARLSFYPNIEGGELEFVTDAIHIVDKNQNKVLSSSDMFFTKSGGGRTVKPNAWKFSANKMNWYIPIFDEPVSMYSFLFNAQLQRFPTMSMKDIYAFLLQRDKADFNTLLSNLFHDLHQRGSTVDMRELRIVAEKGDWSSAQGDLFFDDQLRPFGMLSISTNQAMEVVRWLTDKGIMVPEFLEENNNIRKLLKKRNAVLELSLQLKSGIAYFNGLTSGKAGSILDIINISN